MTFEFDAEQSAANRAKHGIDFIEAQGMWDDPDRIEIPARSLKESRRLVIGRIGTMTWAASVSYRHEQIRLLSVRRARPEEHAAYLAG
jgi:uncharacterized DUF497 family protein